MQIKIRSTLCLIFCIAFAIPQIFHIYAADIPFLKESIREAKKHYEKGEYAEAVTLWNKALSIDPGNPAAKKGIEEAEKKISKIQDFFGSSVFEEQPDMAKLSLKDCLRIAEEGSLPLQVAAEQMNLTKIKMWQARRAFFPSLTFSWTNTKGIQSGGKVESTEYGIEGKQPAFHSGELMYTLAQSKANLNIAQNNYDKVKSEMYFEVAKAYYALVKAKRFLMYAKGLYEKIKPLFEISRNKHDKAVSSDIEYLNAESKISQIYYKSMSAETDFKLAKLDLEQKLNISESVDFDVEPDIKKSDIGIDIDTCVSLAMENRPDLRMSRLTVKSTEYGKKIAQAKEMPSVDLTGNYKKFSEVYRESYSILNKEQKLDPKRKWYAGLEATWPILGSTASYSSYKRKDPPTLSTFDPGFESWGNAWKIGILDDMEGFSKSKEAEIANVRAEDELDKMRKKVIMEVKESFHGYEKAKVQLEAARMQKEYRKKESEILEAKLGLGEIESSELFENMVNQMETHEAYFEAEESLYVSIAALNKAIGVEDYF